MLLQIKDLFLAYGGEPLLDGVSATLHPGERVGLLGRNGAGKSSLLQILAGRLEPDGGEVARSAGLRVALLPQEVPRDLAGPVAEVVAEGSRAEGWEAQHQVDRILSRMDLDPALDCATLSSGMKRRVLLARALAGDPDLLLLDEPTNHLDIQAITWLEGFLERFAGALLFVTHDRAFLRRLASRILEIDRGRLYDWTCDYDTFLLRKEAALLAEEKQNAAFDRKLAEEEAWIRRGIKARRTRNEGRVRALQQMRRERAQRREREGAARVEIQEAGLSGRLVADLKGISFAWDSKPVVEDFSCRILRGDKVGLLGPNGAGKTTLLRLILGELSPDTGTVRLGTNLQVAYFDQLRESLDEEATVLENVGQGRDRVAGRHVVGYLEDFLFSRERIHTPVRSLSGGERNRVLLARLFARPANVLVLDEPTNDLDLETLELLEERLVAFEGTVLVVSHDRDFLDDVVGSVLAFEEGGVHEYVGGYTEWLRQRKTPDREDAPKPSQRSAPERTRSRPAKLGYKEQRELDALPARIEALENELATVQEQLGDPAFYQEGGEKVAAATTRLQELERELAAAYERWEELESRAQGG